jgi:hypothetical protein
MRIEAIEGPIGTELLQHICDLYGRDMDPRYADLEFTRRVFNGNPAGRSFHVFAFEGEQVIGCYAVIPMKVVAHGRKLWAGKGEALYVTEQHRPAGLFLIQRGVSFAMERGLELQFGLTHDRVARILQAMGFTAVPSATDHRFRLFPGDMQQLSASRMKLIAAQGLGAAQEMVGAAVGALLRGSHVSIQLNRADHPSLVFAAISDASHPANGRWSVAIDEESLRWWNNIGCLDVLMVDDKADEFVAVRRARSGNAELIRWNVREGSLARTLKILQLVIEKARRERAPAISVASYADVSGRGYLHKATALLGFVRRRGEATVYVKAVDPFFLAPRNLDFNSLFSI